MESESEKWKLLMWKSHVWLFATPWTIVHGILRPEYWSG